MQQRIQRKVLYDPLYEVVYSRPHRKGSQYQEDASLQDYLADKGKGALREYAMRAYVGYQEAVLP
jgi:hypothetical protein